MTLTEGLLWLKWAFSTDRNRCPNCGCHPFSHGFEQSNRRYFCLNCGFGTTAFVSSEEPEDDDRDGDEGE